jgi:hypothetical protein
MKKVITYLLFLIIHVCHGWSQSDSALNDNTLVLSIFNDPEISNDGVIADYFDENVYLCNWYTNQTFAYWENKHDVKNKIKLCLIQGNEKFSMPVFGKLWSVFKKTHNGLDVDIKTGDSIHTIFDGKVRYAQYNKGGFGNLVIVRHKNGLESYYAHFSKLLVKPGQDVKSGDVIGLGGSTGRSKGPHLHFEVRYHDLAIDPLSFIDYLDKKLHTEELDLNETSFEPWKYDMQPVRVDSVNNIIAGLPVIQKENTLSSNLKNNNLSNFYTVKNGDSLYRIALKFHTTVSKLCSLNKMKATDILQIGKKLRVN